MGIELTRICMIAQYATSAMFAVEAVLLASINAHKHNNPMLFIGIQILMCIAFTLYSASAQNLGTEYRRLTHV